MSDKTTVKNIAINLITDGFTKGVHIIENSISKLGHSFATTIKTNTIEDATNHVINSTTPIDLAMRLQSKAIDKVAEKILGYGIAVMNLPTKVFAKTLSSVKEGFHLYNSELTSTMVMQQNTGESMENITNAMNEMLKYANNTKYSFNDMTQALGLFTAAGVDLNTSKTAIIGISNLAAVSGANINQAKTSMIQLSQAIASGALHAQDYNSVVNAGMGGQKFKQALLDQAVALGDLTSNTVNFKQAMSDGKISSQALINVLQQFANDPAMLKAATTFRSWGEVADMVGENISGTFAQVFKILIGDLDKATALWTGLGNTIENHLNKASDSTIHFANELVRLKAPDEVLLIFKDLYVLLGRIANIAGAAFGVFFKTDMPLVNHLATAAANLRKFTNSIKLGTDSFEKWKKGITDYLTLMKTYLSEPIKLIQTIGSIGITVCTTYFKTLFKLLVVAGQLFAKLALAIAKVFDPIFWSINTIINKVLSIGTIFKQVFARNGSILELSKTMDKLGFLTESARKSFSDLYTLFKRFGVLSNALHDLFYRMVSALTGETVSKEWSLFSKITSILLKTIENGLNIIMVMLGPVFKLLTWIVDKTILLVENVQKGNPVLDSLKVIFASIWSVLLKVGDAINWVFNVLLLPTITTAITKLADFSTKMASVGANNASDAIEKMKDSWEKFKPDIEERLSGPMGALQKAAGIVKKQFESIAEVGLINWLQHSIENIKNAFTGWGDAMKELGVHFEFVEKIKKAFETISKKLDGLTSSTLGLVGIGVGTGIIAYIIGSKVMGNKEGGILGNILGLIKKLNKGLDSVLQSKAFEVLSVRINQFFSPITTSGAKVSSIIKDIGIGVVSLAAGLFIISLIDPKRLESSKKTLLELMSALTKDASVLMGMSLLLGNIGKSMKQFAIAVALFIGALLLVSIIPTQTIVTGIGKLSLAVLALAGTLFILKLATKNMKADDLKSLGLAVIAVAMSILILSVAVNDMSKIPLADLGVGLLGLAGIMVVLAAGMAVLTKVSGNMSKKSIATLLILTYSIKQIVPILKDLGTMKFEQAKTASMVIGVVAAAISAILFVLAKSSKAIDAGKGFINALTGMIVGIGIAAAILGYTATKLNGVDVKPLLYILGALGVVIAAMIIIPKLTNMGQLKLSSIMIAAAAGALLMVSASLYLLKDMKIGNILPIIGGLIAAIGAMVLIMLILSQFEAKVKGDIKKTATVLALAAGVLLISAIAIGQLAKVKVGSMYESIKALMMVFGGVMLGVIGLVAVTKKAGNASAPMKIMLSAIGMLLVVSMVLKHLGKAGNVNITPIATILGLVGGMAIIMVGMTKIAKPEAIKLAATTMGISVAAVAVVGYTISQLSAINWSAMIAPILGIIGIMIVLTVMMVLVIKGVSKFEGGIGKAATVMIGGIVILLAIAYAIKMVSALPFDTMIAGAASMIGILIAITLLFLLTINITKDLGVEDLAKAVGALAGMAVVLILIAAALSMISNIPTEQLIVSAVILVIILGVFILGVAILGNLGVTVVPVTLALAALVASFALLAGAIALGVMAFTQLLDLLKDLTPEQMDNITTNLASLFVDTIVKMMAKVPELVSGFCDMLIGIFKAIGKKAGPVIDAFMKMVIDIINGLAKAIENNGPALIKAIVNLISAILSFLIKDILKPIFLFIVDIFKKIVNIDWGELFNNLLAFGKKLFNGLIKGIAFLVRKIPLIGGAVADAMDGWVGSSEKIGEDAANRYTAGFSRGISSFTMPDSSLSSYGIEVNPLVKPVYDFGAVGDGGDGLSGFGTVAYRTEASDKVLTKLSSVISKLNDNIEDMSASEPASITVNVQGYNQDPNELASKIERILATKYVR